LKKQIAAAYASTQEFDLYAKTAFVSKVLKLAEQEKPYRVDF